MDLYPYEYSVFSRPEGCTQYTPEQVVTLYVPEPPPAEVTLQGNGPCAGTVLKIIVEDE